MTEDGADDAQPPDAPVTRDPVPYDALHYTVQLPATPYSVAAARAISRAWCARAQAATVTARPSSCWSARRSPTPCVTPPAAPAT